MKTKNRKATITNYYDLQDLQYKLYAESSNNAEFYDLMQYITSKENIKLAYRTIKINHGSQTAGTDKKNIKFIADMQENGATITSRLPPSYSAHCSEKLVSLTVSSVFT